MGTTINVTVGGNGLLDRSKQQTQANRNGQLEKESGKRLEQESAQKRQQRLEAENRDSNGNPKQEPNAEGLRVIQEPAANRSSSSASLYVITNLSSGAQNTGAIQGSNWFDYFYAYEDLGHLDCDDFGLDVIRWYVTNGSDLSSNNRITQRRFDSRSFLIATQRSNSDRISAGSAAVGTASRADVTNNFVWWTSTNHFFGVGQPTCEQPTEYLDYSRYVRSGPAFPLSGWASLPVAHNFAVASNRQHTYLSYVLSVNTFTPGEAIVSTTTGGGTFTPFNILEYKGIRSNGGTRNRIAIHTKVNNKNPGLVEQTEVVLESFFDAGMQPFTNATATLSESLAGQYIQSMPAGNPIKDKLRGENATALATLNAAAPSSYFDPSTGRCFFAYAFPTQNKGLIYRSTLPRTLTMTAVFTTIRNLVLVQLNAALPNPDRLKSINITVGESTYRFKQVEVFSLSGISVPGYSNYSYSPFPSR